MKEVEEHNTSGGYDNPRNGNLSFAWNDFVTLAHFFISYSIAEFWQFHIFLKVLHIFRINANGIS